MSKYFYNHGLATPTDWNKECDLLKEYLSVCIYQDKLPNIKIDPDKIPPIENAFDLFQQTGWLIVDHDHAYNKPFTRISSFEEWKANNKRLVYYMTGAKQTEDIAKQSNDELQKRLMGDPKPTDDYRFCNHHHELTPEHEIVDFGTGPFVANKAAIPLLKALNEVGLKTRTHHFNGSENGFVSILLDNVDVEITTVNEIHADRFRFDGKKELLLRWKNEA